MDKKDAYAKAGVDPSKISVFKQRMGEVNALTSKLPIPLGVRPNLDLKHPHGAVYRVGNRWHCTTLEGPGNLPWLAEHLYKVDAAKKLQRKPYHVVSGITAVMMAANDCAAQGARPAVCLDLVAANNSDWFTTKQAADLAKGILEGCKRSDMWLGAGETPSMKYIINEGGPDVAISVTGVVKEDDQLITGERLGPGSAIVGISSCGIHGNGWTLIIDKLLAQEYGFTMNMMDGNRLTDVLLVATANYVSLTNSVLDAGIRPHAILPGTGDGVAKLASDKRDFTYHIRIWPQLSRLFEFLQTFLGLSLKEMFSIFNMGIGYYFFVAPEDVPRVIQIARRHFFQAYHLGDVADGKRGVQFHPCGGIWLQPKA